MRYQIIPVTAFEQNCSLLWCKSTRKGAVIDPGGDIDRILAAVAHKGVIVEKILLTHGHLDHVGGVAELASRLSLPIEGPHRGDDFWIEGLEMQSQMMRLPPVSSFQPSRWLQQGDEVSVGDEVLQVRHCPGHTPGHVIFYHAKDKLAFVGDVLFRGSIGRTDFPRGDYETLIQSIQTQLWSLGDEVSFVPGHGPMSTIGYERESNPFVADKNFG